MLIYVNFSYIKIYDILSKSFLFNDIYVYYYNFSSYNVQALINDVVVKGR